MKKIKFAIAAMVIAAGVVGAFTFNTDAKEEVTNSNDKPLQNVYHYVSQEPNGDINFAPGEPSIELCNGITIPCRFTSEEELQSPMSQQDIEAQATVTNRLD